MNASTKQTSVNVNPKGERNKNEQDYDDNYWHELPDDIRKSALVLGYTESLWNNDNESDSFNKSWRHLTSEQQEAAIKLGYNAKNWDTKDATTTDKSRRPLNKTLELVIFEVRHISKGALHIVLDCLVYVTFYAVFEGLWTLVKDGFQLHPDWLNIFKIVGSVFIMRVNGQIFIYSDDSLINFRPRPSRGNSFLNLITWYSIYSGIYYFFVRLENDFVMEKLYSWYLFTEKTAKEAFAVDPSRGEHDKFTCNEFPKYIPSILDSILGGHLCSMDQSWQAVTLSYSLLVFLGSVSLVFLVYQDMPLLSL